MTFIPEVKGTEYLLVNTYAIYLLGCEEGDILFLLSYLPKPTMELASLVS